jgi:hypothetical protein
MRSEKRDCAKWAKDEHVLLLTGRASESIETHHD